MKPLTHNGMHTIRPTGPSARAVPLGIAFLLGFALLLAASLLVAPPIALSAERYTVPGSQVAIYNLAGEMKVEPYAGSDVVVEVTRGGRDAPELRIESGLRGARQTLRVIYPGKRVVYPKLGLGSRTNLSVRADGTFGDGLKDLLGLGTGVTISGRGNGLEAHADLRVLVPASKDVAVYVGAGSMSAADVEADLKLNASMGAIECSGTRGTLRVNTGSGSVRVRSARGDLAIDTGSGDVATENVEAGRLHIDTGSGSVAINRARAQALDVDTGSGDIVAEDLDAGDIHVDTGSGRVSLALVRSAKRVNIETGSGAVLVRVPRDYEAEFELDTGSGGIDLDMPHTVTRQDHGHLRGRIGDGGGSLRVDTGSGGIQVMRGGSASG